MRGLGGENTKLSYCEQNSQLGYHASLLAGLGLFFVGLQLLTENLKLMSGRRLRENIAVWTRNPFFGLAWGNL